MLSSTTEFYRSLIASRPISQGVLNSISPSPVLNSTRGLLVRGCSIASPLSPVLNSTRGLLEYAHPLAHSVKIDFGPSSAEGTDLDVRGNINVLLEVALEPKGSFF